MAASTSQLRDALVAVRDRATTRTAHQSLSRPLQQSVAGPAGGAPQWSPGPQRPEQRTGRGSLVPAVVLVVLALVVVGIGAGLLAQRDNAAAPQASAAPADPVPSVQPGPSDPVEGAPPPPIDSVARVPLTISDLPGTSLVDEAIWEGPDDGEQPLSTYQYCNVPLDLSGIQTTAVNILANDINDGAFTTSMIGVPDSQATLEQIVDDIVAGAGQCEQFQSGNGLAAVFVDDSERAESGALLQVHFDSAVGDLEPITSYLEIQGRYLTALDLHQYSGDPDALRQIVRDRVAALPQ